MVPVYVFWLGSMYLRHVQLLTLVTLLGWPYRWKGWHPHERAYAEFLATVTKTGIYITVGHAPKLVQGCFLDVDTVTVSGYMVSFLGIETLQHGEEVDAGIGQHASPQL